MLTLAWNIADSVVEHLVTDDREMEAESSDVENYADNTASSDSMWYLFVLGIIACIAAVKLCV